MLYPLTLISASSNWDTARSALARNRGSGNVTARNPLANGGSLSAALSESRDALEEVIEPYLLQQGLIQRTPRGRMLAQKAWAHLGLPQPKGQTDLFG